MQKCAICSILDKVFELFKSKKVFFKNRCFFVKNKLSKKNKKR